MNKVHEVFPLIVYQGSVDSHNYMKKHIDVLREYWFNGYENESPEYSGRIFAHEKDYCKPFFKDLRTNIDNYMRHLNVNHELLDYYVTKSWVGYHKDDETPSVPAHFHNESNISFVYYVHTNESSDKFCVSQSENRNEISGGLFETAQGNNTLLGFNRYNCNHYTITPQEGTVLLFPSNLLHATMKHGRRTDERLVIAGDVRVTLKPEHYKHHQGSTHPSQWMEL